MKYCIDEKESDDPKAIDLSTYKSYLLIPEKFVLVEYEVELKIKIAEDTPPQTFLTTRYQVKTRYADHTQTIKKDFNFETTLFTNKSFFGLIMPSGKVKQIELLKVDKNEKSFYLYSLKRIKDNLSFVTVKNL